MGSFRDTDIGPIFLYLMMFFPIASLKKAFMDSNHPSNISWPRKFRFFRPLRVHC